MIFGAFAVKAFTVAMGKMFFKIAMEICLSEINALKFFSWVCETVTDITVNKSDDKLYLTVIKPHIDKRVKEIEEGG